LTPLRPGIGGAMSAARDRIVLLGMMGWAAFILLKDGVPVRGLSKTD